MTTYYIDSATGSDSNKGTSAATPLESISALEKIKLQPGDSVLFARGETYSGELIVKYSGTVASPITIGAYGDGAPPVLSGASTGISASKTQNVIIQDLAVANTSSNAIYAHGATNLTIQNVHVLDTGTPTHSGAISMEGSSNVTIKGSTISGVTGDGIWISGGSNITLEQNSISTVQGSQGDNIQVTGATNISVLDNYLDMTGQTNTTKGNLVVNTSEGVDIENNTMIGGSYGASVNSNDVVIAHNEVYGQSGYSWSFGIGIGETWNVQNYQIHDNYVHDVGYGVAITGSGSTPLERTNINVYDNTFDDITGAALKVDRPASGDFVGNDVSANSTPTRISADIAAAGTFSVGDNATFITTAPHANPDVAIAGMHASQLHGDLLTNDVSVSGGTLSVTEFDGQAVTGGFDVAGKYGSVAVDQFGNFVYTVNEAAVQNITGEVSEVFKYLITDGQQQTYSTLTVDVMPRAELKPIAVNDGTTVDANGLATGNVLANDHDGNNDTLYVRSANTIKVGTSPVDVAGHYGTLVISADGSYTYHVDPTKVPVGDSLLSDNFTYKMSDSIMQDTGSLTIHIDSAGLVLTPNADFHI